MIFVNDPPTAEMHCIPVVRTRDKNPLSVCCATRELRGVWTHWHGGKTIACCDTDECLGCLAHKKLTWQGHIVGYRLNDDQLILCPFTLAVKTFLIGIKRNDFGLYGQMFRMTRMGSRETGPIGCTWLRNDFTRREVTMGALEKIVSRLYADNSNQREVFMQG